MASAIPLTGTKPRWLADDRVGARRYQMSRNALASGSAMVGHGPQFQNRWLAPFRSRGANPRTTEKKPDWLKLLAKILRDLAKIMKTKNRCPFTAYHDISATQELVAKIWRYHRGHILVLAVLNKFPSNTVVGQYPYCERHGASRRFPELVRKVTHRWLAPCR